MNKHHKESEELQWSKNLARVLQDAGVQAHLEHNDAYYAEHQELPCTIVVHRGEQLDIEWVAGKYTCWHPRIFGGRPRYWRWPEGVLRSIVKELGS